MTIGRSRLFAILLACVAGFITTNAPAAPSEIASPVKAGETLYTNANVWDGKAFVTRNLAVRDGHFVDPATLGAGAAQVDLAARYVVPGYGNAHCHLTAATDDVNKVYLDSGVFYAWNPNTRVLGETALAYLKRPDTFDVLTAQGGITEPGGHPEVLYAETLGPRVYPGMSKEDMLGNMFHYGRTHAEISAALDLLVAQHADFVKVYLLHSEDYERRKTDPQFYGRHGVDPLNLPFLVQEAAKRGLFVAAHLETVEDLRAAAIAGVAVAEHLPGYTPLAPTDGPETIRLTEGDAALVARAHMLVVPTYSLGNQIPQGLEGDALAAYRERQQLTFEIQAENLRLLQAANVPILAGTDTLPPIFDEVEHWVKIGGLSTQDALADALGTGSRLFANRRIGCFDAGCEADFLVLDADPLANIAALRTIGLRVKAGREVG